ncbi:MAG: hypothetical protein KGI90_05345 [Burkholderiales bacterium]|nr:hypothetical protein [Burkholderiales bacterium]MDE2565063.1 hypothetical protein [Burkholderiales bacterium]
MTALTHKPTPGPVRRRRVEDERTFQLLFLLSFPIFLAMALGARVLPGAKSGDEARQPRGSLFTDAATTARSTLAIALND